MAFILMSTAAVHRCFSVTLLVTVVIGKVISPNASTWDPELDFRQATVFIENFSLGAVVAIASNDAKLGDRVILAKRNWKMPEDERMTWIDRGRFISGLNERQSFAIQRTSSKKDYSVGDPVVLSWSVNGTKWFLDKERCALVAAFGSLVLTVEGKDAQGNHLLVVDKWRSSASQRWILKETDNLMWPPSRNYLEQTARREWHH